MVTKEIDKKIDELIEYHFFSDLCPDPLIYHDESVKSIFRAAFLAGRESMKDELKPTIDDYLDNGWDVTLRRIRQAIGESK